MEMHETLAKIGEKVDAMKADTARVESLADRLGDLEARSQFNSPSGKTGTSEQKEHLAMFTRWLRRPHDLGLKSELQQVETKVASGLSDSAGGTLVPEILTSQIISQIKDRSAMRSIANVMTVSSGDVKFPISQNNATSQWSGETATRSATTEPTVLERKPTFGTVNAYISASEELVYDSQFPIDVWFRDAVADQIAAAEGAAFISGNGSDRPTGILNTAPESAGDDDSPARTSTALQYLATGAAGAFAELSTTSPVTYPDNVLVDTVFALKSGYRQDAVWVMNSNTAATIRKFRDADGRMLWADGLAQGQPARLLGYEVVIDEQMPAIAANSHSVLFGDFRRAYGIFDCGGVRVTLDDNVTQPGKLRWYIRRRVGGITLDHHAAKAVKFAAS